MDKAIQQIDEGMPADHEPATQQNRHVSAEVQASPTVQPSESSAVPIDGSKNASTPPPTPGSSVPTADHSLSTRLLSFFDGAPPAEEQ